MNSGWAPPPRAGRAPETHPLETLALCALGGLVAAGTLLWATGQVSGRLFSGVWPPVRISEIGSVLTQYPHHLGAPAQAWRGRARELIPGPLAFYATLIAVVSPAVGAGIWISSRRSRRATDTRSARWARPRDLRLLHARGDETGRLTLGRVNGRLVAAEPRQSVIVIGPTQTGKTTGFAIPAILEWEGPVVATSVKTDLLRETLTARSSRPDANAWIYDPTSSTGLPTAGWTPLMQCLSWQGAQRAADWLVRAARPRSATNEAADFWYGSTAKLLAPILLAAACSGGTMAQVVRWVDVQEDEPVQFALEANGQEEAVIAFEAVSMWDERTRGSVYATAQTVLIAYTDPGVLASAMTSELRAEWAWA
jgi:type IV secretion system protein VirD4